MFRRPGCQRLCGMLLLFPLSLLSGTCVLLPPARAFAKAVALDKDYCEHAPHMRPQQLQGP